MMSGAVWVRDRLEQAGWRVEVADARKVKALAPLAAKTDKVDARVLATLAFRDLVPAVWIPSLSERALREQLKRRAHLIRLRSSAKNRCFRRMRPSRAPVQTAPWPRRILMNAVPARRVTDFETKQHKADANGELLYNLQVVALDDWGAEVIQLKVAGDPKVP